MLPSANCLAWGIVGHRIVCDIAYDMLIPETRRSVDRFVAAFTKPNGKRFKHFAEACHFADTARHNARDGHRRWLDYAKYDGWHYVNVPRNTAQINMDTTGCARDCVLYAIEVHAQLLGDKNLPSSQRGKALILLAHWVGDVHQPMHVSFADDRGGSQITLDKEQGYGRHLHAAWDAGIIKASRGKQGLGEYIEALNTRARAQRHNWQSNTRAIDWAEESFNIVTSPIARYCKWRKVNKGAGGTERRCESINDAYSLDSAYVSQIAPILEKRLIQAAIRLAFMLERLLGHAT